MFAQPTAIYTHGPGLTRRVQLVQEKLPTLPVHLSSPQFSVAFEGGGGIVCPYIDGFS
jgi:hypothetical protein